VNVRFRFILLTFLLVVLTCLILGYFFQTIKQQESPQIKQVSEQSSPGWPTVVSPTPIPLITIEQIFSDNHAWVNDIASNQIVTIVATGDVLTARVVNQKMVQMNNFHWPFEKTQTLLTSADLTIINLETPLLVSCPVTNTGMLFCGDARATEGLLYAGVDLATLGNNHMGNHFIEGIEETKQILTNAGINYVVDEPVIKVVNGTKFAFLSYNDIGAPEQGVPWADDNKIIQGIAEAKKLADIVIVAPHWGVEYVTMPSSRQRNLARLMIDSGADLIIGNHPHWIQPVELYKAKLIMYAHGNFIFDQEWSEETKTGVVGKYTFVDNRLVDAEFVPIRIVEYGQPHVLEGEQKKRVLDEIRSASITLNSQ
jgi:poly-gamma-glutamate capsule biosynthesis protein CapA/YwtB (metallophosphatase superfamily)